MKLTDDQIIKFLSCFVDDIRLYEHEAAKSLHEDERSSTEIAEIFIKSDFGQRATTLLEIQPIKTSERLPTEEDADSEGSVCAYDAILSFWNDMPFTSINDPIETPYWFSYPDLPEPPKKES